MIRLVTVFGTGNLEDLRRGIELASVGLIDDLICVNVDLMAVKNYHELLYTFDNWLLLHQIILPPFSR